MVEGVKPTLLLGIVETSAVACGCRENGDNDPRAPAALVIGCQLSPKDDDAWVEVLGPSLPAYRAYHCQ